MSKKQWCNLCYCYYTNSYTHTNGKRHKKRLCLFAQQARVLSEETKYNIISFLYPNISNIHTLYKEFHYINIRSCQREIEKKMLLLINQKQVDVTLCNCCLLIFGLLGTYTGLKGSIPNLLCISS